MRSPDRSAAAGPPTLSAGFSNRSPRRRRSVVLRERHEVISIVGGELLLDHHRLQRHRESHLSVVQTKQTSEDAQDFRKNVETMHHTCRSLYNAIGGAKWNSCSSQKPHPPAPSSWHTLAAPHNEKAHGFAQATPRRLKRITERACIVTPKLRNLPALSHRSDENLGPAGQGVRPALGVHPAQPEPRSVRRRLAGSQTPRGGSGEGASNKLRRMSAST